MKIKRVYEESTEDDGRRVLVDRLWPRGLSKEKAAVDLWLKEIGPSTELRQWFAHDPDKWDEFQRRYGAELTANAESVAELRQALNKGTVTLLYGSKDQRYNNAVALREYLCRRFSKELT